MDVYVELTRALVEMVKQGGYLAIWGIFVWMTLGIIKIGLILYLVAWVVRSVLTSIDNYHTLKHINKQHQISLLPSKTAKHLENILKEFRDTTTSAMKDFIKESQGLLKNSTKK